MKNDARPATWALHASLFVLLSLTPVHEYFPLHSFPHQLLRRICLYLVPALHHSCKITRMLHSKTRTVAVEKCSLFLSASCFFNFVVKTPVFICIFDAVSGFRERSSAFDFKAVLDEFVRFLDRQKKAKRNAAVEVRQIFCFLRVLW